MIAATNRDLLAEVRRGAFREDFYHRAREESRGDYKLAALKLNIHPNSLLRLVRTLGLRELLK